MDGDVWRVKVHRLADPDMRQLKATYPDEFADMIDALKALSTCGNIFDVRFPLDTCLTYPDADDCVRFKKRGQIWRVILRVIHRGLHVTPTADMRPCEDTYLQIIFVDDRGNRTYDALRLRVLDMVRG